MHSAYDLINSHQINEAMQVRHVENANEVLGSPIAVIIALLSILATEARSSAAVRHFKNTSEYRIVLLVFSKNL